MLRIGSNGFSLRRKCKSQGVVLKADTLADTSVSSTRSASTNGMLTFFFLLPFENYSGYELHKRRKSSETSTDDTVSPRIVGIKKKKSSKNFPRNSQRNFSCEHEYYRTVKAAVQLPSVLDLIVQRWVYDTHGILICTKGRKLCLTSLGPFEARLAKIM